MKEQTSFFGSKMLSIDSYISVSDLNIIYYEADNGEQVSYLIEKNNQPIIYSMLDDKNSNHIIKLDESQSPVQKSSNTRWIIKIDTNTILSNFLFATLKKYRTFEGVTSDMTLNNSVDRSINDYITQNLLNRYKFSNLEFYVSYNHYSQSDTFKYKNTFTEIFDSSNLVKKIQSVLDDKNFLTVIFSQEQPSTSYNFNYYFNLYFEKV
jgi:hypothetical protein